MQYGEVAMETRGSAKFKQQIIKKYGRQSVCFVKPTVLFSFNSVRIIFSSLSLRLRNGGGILPSFWPDNSSHRLPSKRMIKDLSQ